MADERPKAGEIEERTACELVTADGKKIRGRVPYGVESRDMGGWREVIEPTAFRNTVFDDLVATVDHAGVPLGRHPTTLELEDRADGLHWAVDPPESRADIREAVERGDLRAGSWRMVVGKDEWRGDVRHIHDVAVLRDVSIVTRPAYQDAVIEYRSQPDPAAGQEETAMATVANQNTEEERTANVEEARPPAGSLRVEERAVAPVFMSLADAFAQRGFFENRTAEVSWDEFRTVWVAGTALTDLNPVRREGVPLGYDTRWLYPVLPQTSVSDATTAVSYLRQSGRVLAGTAVIRPLDSVTTKPSVAGTAELVTAQLSQVAAIHPDVPRIHAAQPIFQSIIENDLRLSINDGLDEVVRRGVSTAGTAPAVTGTDVLQKVRKTMTIVQAQGYQPSVLAIDPAGAESLDLLQTVGSEKFYVWGPGRATPTGPFGLTMRVWKTARTALLDADAFGRLDTSPVELRAFEQDAGATNRQTYRMETNATFTVERLSAGLRII
jgi:Escherichia/Staphylococcus phage prohead protease